VTRLLGTPFSSTQNSLPEKSKFVDQVTVGKSFLAERLAAAPLLGTGFYRKDFLKKIESNEAVGGLVDSTIDFYDLLDRDDGYQAWIEQRNEQQKLDDAYREQEFAELDHEENAKVLLDYLPDVWKPFLENMKQPRRGEREDAIWKKVGRDGLQILQHDARELADYAGMKARAYARQFPARDENGEFINQEEKHQKGRCEKWHLRRLKKQQMRALLYIESAIGAVGGPLNALRPLYVSEYVLDRYLDHVARTEEILKDLRLVKKLDPSVQIPMSEVNRKAKRAAAAKRRLLMDMSLARWEALGWHVCWITITLPGEFVPYSTNEPIRKSRWNIEHGPAEAMDAIQLDMKRTMALLRDRGVRPTGWWNVQPQQSGAPHRHIILACEEIDDARAVCDAFRDRFSTRLIANEGDNDGQDHGCAAYVIGDEDPRYKTRISKQGSEESATSAAKYAARYATHYETDNDLELCDKEPETEAEAEKIKSIKDFRRFLAWKWGRRARTHTWLGLDTGRVLIVTEN